MQAVQDCPANKSKFVERTVATLTTTTMRSRPQAMQSQQGSGGTQGGDVDFCDTLLGLCRQSHLNAKSIMTSQSTTSALAV
jgi:hypothetical protein